MKSMQAGGPGGAPGGGRGDFSAMREKEQRTKDALDTEIAKVLTADQLKKWNEATSMTGHGPGGPFGDTNGPPPPPGQ